MDAFNNLFANMWKNLTILLMILVNAVLFAQLPRSSFHLLRRDEKLMSSFSIAWLRMNMALSGLAAAMVEDYTDMMAMILRRLWWILRNTNCP